MVVLHGPWGYFYGHRDIRSLARHGVGGGLALVEWVHVPSIALVILSRLK